MVFQTAKFLPIVGSKQAPQSAISLRIVRGKTLRQAPAAWCHRGQLSAHLQDALGIEVYEFGMEDQGCGWRHPKLLPEFKK
jgi:hypothetical protein